MVKPVFVFGKFKRPSAALEMVVPKLAALQSGERVFNALCRLLTGLLSVSLGQDEVNGRNSVVKHKASHCRQVFVLKSARPPPTAVRAKAKLTSEIRDHAGDMPTAS
jgi:hypothetical protein